MYRVKFSAVLLFVFFEACIYSLNLGFEIKSSSVFLGKSTNKFFPEAVSGAESSVFYSFNFNFQNQSLCLQPGLFLKNTFSSEVKTAYKVFEPSSSMQSSPTKVNVLHPFFRKLNYSVFTEYVFFTLGKDSIYFGEGFTANNFFINAPGANSKDDRLWHIKLEIPVKQFTFITGTAADSESIALFQLPKWYNIWLQAVYSNQYIFAGFEADTLIKPSAETINQRKEIIFKTAGELSAVLPHDFKLYTNACIPVSLFAKKITNWGVLAGASKNFLIDDFSFTTIAEGSLSSQGFNYAFFESFGLAEYAQITAGLMGFENSSLKFIAETELLIADLRLKFSYVSKNVLKKDEKPQDIFIVGVIFNE